VAAILITIFDKVENLCLCL